jgi:hypothetical protein
MSQIVKAEFLYSFRGFLVLAVLIIPGCLIYSWTSETAGLNGMLLPLTVGSILQPVVLRTIEHRDRQHILLPQTCRKIALARLLVIATPVVVFYTLYLISHFLFRSLSTEWNHDAFDLMMFSGLVLLGFSVYFLQQDSQSILGQRTRRVEFQMALLIVVIVAAYVAIPIALAPIFGPTGNLLRVLCFILGITIPYLMVMTFIRRRSYF